MYLSNAGGRDIPRNSPSSGATGSSWRRRPSCPSSSSYRRARDPRTSRAHGAAAPARCASSVPRHPVRAAVVTGSPAAGRFLW